MDIKKKANYLARKYHSRNPFEIIKGLNVILVFAPLCGVRGFYQYFQRNNIIYIDENLPHQEQIYVCAHELGHMFLHKKANALFMDSRTFQNVAKYEIQANKFAMELLISDQELKEYSKYTIEQISSIYGYDKTLIELKLK